MLPALVLAIVLLAAGCGGGERSFEAEEFVEAVNEHGAGLTLDGPLANEQEGVDIFAVSVTGEAHAERPAEDPHAHGGAASLVIAADEEVAAAEHRRCEGAVSFLCYRAANAVLIVEAEIEPDELERIGAAIRSLESD